MANLMDHIADLTVRAQLARTTGSTASADQIDEQIIETVQEARLRGDFESDSALRNGVSRSVTARYGQHLSELLELSKHIKP